MIFDRMRKYSPAPGGRCRSHLSVTGKIKKTDNNNNLRRKRMEIRKMRKVAKETFGQQQQEKSNDSNSDSNSSGSDASPKSKRTENIYMQDEEIDDEMFLHRPNNVATPCNVCSTYGTISVIGRRREMEDALAVELGFLRQGGKSYDFFGVYDGHGGYRVAEVCSEKLHKVVVDMLDKEDEVCEEINWKKVMGEGFKKVDEEVNKYGKEVATMGSTAVVAVVGDDEIVIANCGDSRALMYRGGTPVQLSDDHKPDRPDERSRIEDSGGKVIDWNGQRVLGVLATSRSIGDQYLKPYVIPEPEVKVINRTNLDEFIILASDGLWDVIKNDVACEVTRRCLDGQIRRNSQSGVRDDQSEGGSKSNSRASEAAAVLAELAIARGSSDNVSVVVVELKRPVFGQIGSSSST